MATFTLTPQQLERIVRLTRGFSLPTLSLDVKSDRVYFAVEHLLFMVKEDGSGCVTAPISQHIAYSYPPISL